MLGPGGCKDKRGPEGRGGLLMSGMVPDLNPTPFLQKRAYVYHVCSRGRECFALLHLNIAHISAPCIPAVGTLPWPLPSLKHLGVKSKPSHSWTTLSCSVLDNRGSLSFCHTHEQFPPHSYPFSLPPCFLTLSVSLNQNHFFPACLSTI